MSLAHDPSLAALTPLPVSETVQMDLRIGEIAQRIAGGTSSSSDIACLNQLIRDRADLMMPTIFSEMRARRA